MRFWDASAIVPLCVVEPHSASLKALLVEDPSMAVWWGTPLECRSAFARIRREGILDIDEELQAVRPLAALMKSWTEMSPSEEIRGQALRSVSTHPLKSSDALQLASALVWAHGLPGNHGFVCLDRQLRTAAKTEGFVVLPESLGT